ncbi:MAG: hypothetical protein N2317_06175 [Syntrophales bacterium]|nr:hypothetical protein [Syntrophales bacterium]
MKVKRYEVTSIQEALNMIKKELGPEAIIISTKTLKGTNPRIIEVIAAVDYEKDSKIAMPDNGYLEVTDKKKFARRLDGLEDDITELKEALFRLENRWDVRRDLHDLRDRIDALFEFFNVMHPFYDNDLLGSVFRVLLRNGISKPQAIRIICQAQSDPSFSGAKNMDDILRIVERVVEGVVVKEPVKKTERIKVFVGPPGVGKTTTVPSLLHAFTLTKERKQH